MIAWRGEVCKACGRRNPIGFDVSANDWRAVTGGDGSVRCLTCFDEEAERKGIRYTPPTGLYPVAWWQWSEDT